MKLTINDIGRLAAFAVLSFAFSFGLPAFDVTGSTTSIIHLMLLFSFLMGFFINRALERRKTVNTTIEVELSRLRRIYNLSKRVSQQEWAPKLIAALKHYHEEVAQDLFSYGKALKSYRNVLSMVYDYVPETPKDKIVFADLLQTTRDVALERRPLERALDSHVPKYGWAIMILLVLGIAILLMLNRGDGISSFSAAATLTILLSVLDLLHQTDHLNQAEVEKFQKLYKDNLEG